jgi:Ni2+-binding GTPase involved in maturation of urease and hydrogenase
MTAARYVMVGGFLGAGKTTALVRLAERLKAEGKRVGLITNDQSVGLVDTALAAAHDLPVEEITGGCFCCRFDSLTAAADKLSKEERPDVFLAEPVGSCTDLAATVSYPLRRLYGDQYTIAPYSVLVDPVRAERVLGLAPGKSFSPKVLYIYGKQLEEADVIVVNKADTLDPARLDRLTVALREKYPKAEVRGMSARTGDGFDGWADRIATGEAATGPAMAVDYDVYAEGEALLGWANATARLADAEPFDGNRYVRDLAADLRQRLQAQGAEVAHLKMTLSPDDGPDLAVVNLTHTDDEPEQSHELHEVLEVGDLIVNLRAEADPGVLRQAILLALDARTQATGINAVVEHLEAFRPGRPVPTHRDTGVPA